LFRRPNSHSLGKGIQEALVKVPNHFNVGKDDFDFLFRERHFNAFWPFGFLICLIQKRASVKVVGLQTRRMRRTTYKDYSVEGRDIT